MLLRQHVTASTALCLYPVGVLASVVVAVLAEAPLFADRVLGDTVMAPALLGLPLWGCVYSLLAVVLPTVRCGGHNGCVSACQHVSSQAGVVRVAVLRGGVVGAYCGHVEAGVACALAFHGVAMDR